MTTDTPGPLETIRQRWARATPGPWQEGRPDPNDDRPIVAMTGPLWTHEGPMLVRGGVEGGGHRTQADAEAIAHAPADIAYLLNYIERLEKTP